MKVLFDFVPNHTSINHPYAESVKKYGKASEFYDFYQRDMDGAKYASNYHRTTEGFIYYFWEDLINLNYKSEIVQRWMIEACKYWVREFDIDGFRFDAVWGVNARMPAFGNKLRMALKAIKPDLFLLAEDKPGLEVYASGFDAAYDWEQDTSWVSHWSWQYRYHEKESHTVFNHPDVNKRAGMLRKAIFDQPMYKSRTLHFMENNDLPRFGVHHSDQQVRMVAALLLSLPGIPLLYNGQEVGVKAHPYTRHSVFAADKSIRSLDSISFDYYQKLLRLRKKYPALSVGAMEHLPVANSQSVFAFHRWHEEDHFLVLLNLAGSASSAVIDLTPLNIGKPGEATDVISGKSVEITRRGPHAYEALFDLDGFSAMWLRFR